MNNSKLTANPAFEPIFVKRSIVYSFTGRTFALPFYNKRFWRNGHRAETELFTHKKQRAEIKLKIIHLSNGRHGERINIKHIATNFVVKWFIFSVVTVDHPNCDCKCDFF